MARLPRKTAARERLQYGSICRRRQQWMWEYYAAPGDKKKVSERICSVAENLTRDEMIRDVNARIASRPRRTVVNNSDAVSASMVIADYVESVYLPWAKTNRRPATYNSYRKLYHAHIKAHFASKTFRQYETFMASNFLNELAREGRINGKSISKIRTLMSGMFSHALESGCRIQGNPIQYAKMRETPRKQQEETPHYSLEEMGAILDALDKDETAQEHCAMALAFSGLRTAEISGLMWADVDGSVLHIQRSAWQSKVNESTKTKKTRFVPIGAFAIKSLKRWQDLAPESIKGFIFQNEAGNPRDFGTFAMRDICPALKAAGVGDLWKGFYAGRRGTVTAYRGNTSDYASLAQAFGHTENEADKSYDKGRIAEVKRVVDAFDVALVNASVRGKAGMLSN